VIARGQPGGEITIAERAAAPVSTCPVIQAIILAFSFVYVLINLIVDLSYTIFDPRIRY
jgi:ABC-type dipeptide/oligopeptide/nickel transport system permease component